MYITYYILHINIYIYIYYVYYYILHITYITILVYKMCMFKRLSSIILLAQRIRQR